MGLKKKKANYNLYYIVFQANILIFVLYVHELFIIGEENLIVA
jgi:hypothetical protein